MQQILFAAVKLQIKLAVSVLLARFSGFRDTLSFQAYEDTYGCLGEGQRSAAEGQHGVCGV